MNPELVAALGGLGLVVVVLVRALLPARDPLQAANDVLRRRR